tara:strand:- start:812 stop:1054 length:243 start_codon:yes stop_codon:yes gene_type:complete
MKRFLVGLILISFLISSQTENEIGRYQLETLTYTSKKGTVYIVETIIDTKTGKIVKRAKKKASSYKLPYKNHRGKWVKED